MNTPDTEWDKHAQRADYFEPDTLVMTLDNIDLLLSSRDTYWMERVQAEREALLMKIARIPKMEFKMSDVMEAITNEDNLK